MFEEETLVRRSRRDAVRPPGASALLGAFLSAVGLAAGLTLSPATQAQEKQIRIGVVYDLTGEFFASGGLDRVRDALAADELPRRVVEMVYSDVDPVLWGAAELSVRAQLEYLAHRD